MRSLVAVFAVIALFAGCSLSVDYTGTYFPCGENDECPDDFVCKQDVCVPTEPAPPTCSSAVAAGRQHTCMVRDPDGSVWCWGLNNSGQLGDGTTTDSDIPVLVDIVGASAVITGDAFSCALVEGGAVKCWGSGNSGQLGNGSATDSPIPRDVSGISGATTIVAGGRHACALLAGGAPSCWGENEGGQIGNGTSTDATSPIPVGVTGVTAIAASDDSTCVIANAGLTCWGFNGEGLFMRGDTMNNNTPMPTLGLTDLTGVAIGGSHLCVFNATGEVKCAGNNENGQLGAGTTMSSTMPVDVFVPATVVSMSLGSAHSCAVDDQARAWCWGANNGRLGLGSAGGNVVLPVLTKFENVATIAAGGDHTCARSREGSIACAGFNGQGQLGNAERMTQSLAQPVPNVTNVTQITAGGDFTCALLGTGEAQCWGRGNDGELGDGTFDTRPVASPTLLDEITDIRAGDDHVCAIRTDKTVQCWGANGSGQLGDGTTGTRGFPREVPLFGGATQLALGDAHSCALLEDSTVQCWGSNSSLQIGDATVVGNALVPVTVPGVTATMIAANGAATCALDNGQVTCWGSGGNLGSGDNNQVSSAAPVRVARDGVATPLTGVIEIAGRGGVMYARLDDGTVRAWGGSTCSNITVGDFFSDCQAEFASQILDLASATTLAPGFGGGCANKATGVSCWGRGEFGQIGDGQYRFSTGAVSLAGLGTVTDLSAGGEHVCAVTPTSEVVCWGFAGDGALGDGVLSNVGPDFVRLTCN